MNADAESERGEFLLLALGAALLLLCFVCGGDSARGNSGTVAAQLAAVPILVIAIARCIKRGRLACSRWAIFSVLSILLVPVLQLLPLPASLWSLPAARVALLQDLNAAGVTAVVQRWSLSPAATERDIYFLLPGLALFFCMLALERTSWRRMLGLIVALCVGSVVLAFAQVAAGQQSFLNPYPEFAPTMGGIFANRNHQADMFAIGLMLVAVFLLDAWKLGRQSGHWASRVGMLAFVSLILAFSLPLVGSRAGVIIAMVMLIGVLLSSGLPTMRTFRHSRMLQIGTVLGLVVFVAGLQAALAWMKADVALEGSRHALLAETLRIGMQHAPLGSGIGTFIPAFQQGAGDALLMNAYINNAHNEYAQWWLEGGVLGVLVVVLALAVLVKTLVSLLRLRHDSRVRVLGMASMMGMGVIILHSSVDYPLRTQALMSVFSVLAGIAVAAASTCAAAKSELDRSR